MLQQVSPSLACQHSLPHHTHPALGPCVWVVDRSLSTSVGLCTSLGYNGILALGNGYQTTTEKKNQKKPNPSPPEPKRSGAEQEAFSRCKSECLELFRLVPFYQTMHPQGLRWDLSKRNKSSCSVKETINLHKLTKHQQRKSFQHLGRLPQGIKK